MDRNDSRWKIRDILVFTHEFFDDFSRRLTVALVPGGRSGGFSRLVSAFNPVVPADASFMTAAALHDSDDDDTTD